MSKAGKKIMAKRQAEAEAEETSCNEHSEFSGFAEEITNISKDDLIQKMRKAYKSMVFTGPPEEFVALYEDAEEEEMVKVVEEWEPHTGCFRNGLMYSRGVGKKVKKSLSVDSTFVQDKVIKGNTYATETGCEDVLGQREETSGSPGINAEQGVNMPRNGDTGVDAESMD